MNSLKVNIEYCGGLIKARLEIDKELKKFFCANTLYYKYDRDISAVPKSVLNVPILSNLITLSWAAGFDLLIPEIDEDYCNSLEEVKKVFMKWHPDWPYKGKIHTKLIKNASKGLKTGLLFSGGIDSIFSFIQNKKESPDLYSVWGTDVPIRNRKLWRMTEANIRGFARYNRLRAHFIETDCRELLDDLYIAAKLDIDSWWGDVSHGIILTSAAAPAAFNDARKILIAASFSSGVNTDLKAGHGSAPETDEKISIAGIKFSHDSYEYTRQQKIINGLSKNKGLCRFLKACYYNFGKLNCGRCEKCYRTILGLITAGLNPNECNFNFNRKDYPRIISSFQKGVFRWAKGLASLWEDIQNNIDEGKIPAEFYDESFFKWLKNFNFREYRPHKLRSMLNMTAIKRAPLYAGRKIRKLKMN